MKLYQIFESKKHNTDLYIIVCDAGLKILGKIWNGRFVKRLQSIHSKDVSWQPHLWQRPNIKASKII